MVLFALLALPVFSYIREGDLVNILGMEDYTSFNNEFYSDLRVFFIHAPFSSECKRIYRDFFQTAKKLTFAKLPVKLAKIDLTQKENKQMLIDLNFVGFPKVYYTLGGTDKVFEFLSPLNEKNFLYHFHFSAPFFQTFNEIEEFNNFFKTAKFWTVPLIIGVFQEFSGPKYELFENFARNHMNYMRFGLVKDSGEWSARFDMDDQGIAVANPPKMSGFRDKPFFNTTSIHSQEEIKDFIWNKGLLMVKWLTKDREAYIRTDKRPLGILIVDFDQEKNQKDIEKYASSFNKKLSAYFTKKDKNRKMLIGMAEKQNFIEDLTDLGLQKENKVFLIKVGDTVRVLRGHKMIDQEGQIDFSLLYEFTKSYFEKSIKPYKRSEIPPTENFDRGLRVAVAETFDQIVVDTDIDHLILIYGSKAISKEAIREIEELVQVYSHPREFQVVKMDGDKNEVLSHYKTIYPAIFYASGITDKRIPQRYPAKEIKLEGVMEFIKNQEGVRNFMEKAIKEDQEALQKKQEEEQKQKLEEYKKQAEDEKPDRIDL